MSKYVQTLNRLRDETEGSAEPTDSGAVEAAAGQDERSAPRRDSVDREIRRAAALEGSDSLFDRLRALAVEGRGTMDESYLTGEPYLIAKVPGSSQGGYMVYNGPRKLAHGESLEDVLKVFERKLKLLTS